MFDPLLVGVLGVRRQGPRSVAVAPEGIGTATAPVRSGSRGLTANPTRAVSNLPKDSQAGTRFEGRSPRTTFPPGGVGPRTAGIRGI